MKKLLLTDTWKLFTYLLLPYVFFDNQIGFILNIIWLLGCFCWLLMLGAALRLRLPEGHDLSFSMFRLSMSIVLAYLTFTIVLFLTTRYNINIDSTGQTVERRDFVMLTLHILTIFSAGYCFYFLSKAITTIEQDKNVSMKSYVATFFLFCILTIGVWWIHPRIKRIIVRPN